MIVNVMAEAPFGDNVTTGPLRDPASRDRVEFQMSMYDDAYQLLDEFAALCATTYAIVSKLGLSDQLLDKHTAICCLAPASSVVNGTSLTFAWWSHY